MFVSVVCAYAPTVRAHSLMNAKFNAVPLIGKQVLDERIEACEDAIDRKAGIGGEE